MQIMNGTGFQVEANQATDKHGKVYCVVVAKATYTFPETNDSPIHLVEPTQQLPLSIQDHFEGEEGTSTPYFENDWAFRKACCDIILKATAYAPQAKETTQLTAGFRLGTCQKEVQIIGERYWEKSFWGMSPTEPQPFVSMPITYSRSYGGHWPQQDNDDGACCLENPVGCGFADKAHQPLLEGKLLPTIGPPGLSVDDFSKPYTPWSFGPLGRNWLPRTHYAGTYDQQWQQEVFPLWPADFDERFFQCAPLDQQIPYPQGGEHVVLHNLHPDRPEIRFALPKNLSLTTVALVHQQPPQKLPLMVDTIIIDADAHTISLVWRAQLPVKRSLREIHSIVIGRVCKRWWDAQRYGTENCGCGGIEAKDDDMISVAEALNL